MSQSKFLLACVFTAIAILQYPDSVWAEPLADREIRKRIDKHRTADITLTVRDKDGRPLAGTTVTVQQMRHKFLFGCNAFQIGRIKKPKLHDGYRNKFAALLNYATLPFYWGGYERKPGETQKHRLEAMARWCAENGITTKGHPLCWHTVTPDWLEGKSLGEVEKLQIRRIRRDVEAFRGKIDMWDVVNEAVVMPDYKVKANPITKLCKKTGRVELIKKAFAEARKANPEAILLLNDYDISHRYVELIEKCIDANAQIDAIGIQSHMHMGYWGAARAWEVCQMFSKFDIPIHFTELTILSGHLKTDQDWLSYHPGWNTTAKGEARQAEQVVELYRVLFSHPSVEAITWWDFSDLDAWQGAPAGLVQKDMSPKPAYTELKKLIKDKWWTDPIKLQTNSDGQVNFNGYLGDYKVTCRQGAAMFSLQNSGMHTVKVKIKDNSS